MIIFLVNRSKKWLKNHQKKPKFMHKSALKVKIRKNLQKMTTVDAKGHPKLSPSTKETLVIFGFQWLICIFLHSNWKVF